MPGPISFRSLRSVSLSVAVLAFGLNSALPAAQAQTLSTASKSFLTSHPSLRIPAQANRVAAGANFAEKIQVSGNIASWVSPDRQIVSAMSPSSDFRIVVVLQRDSSVQAAFKQFLEDQQNPSSPLYHQWISPEQVGELFGPTESDINAVTGWITAQGLTATVSPNRMEVEVKGSTAAVSNALHTSFANFQVNNGQTRYSAVSEPIIPMALTSVIAGFHGLSELRFHPDSVRNAAPVRRDPNLTATDPKTGTQYHYLMPNDFSTIYDINSVYTGGNTGATIGSTTQRIAIIGRSHVAASDISGFASYAAITPNYITTVVPGATDPGTTNDGNQDEATLDVDRIVGTARGALAELLIAKSTTTQDGVDLAINYEINTLKDPIMSVSFGDCEADNSPSVITNYDNAFSTAAAGGISVFVSSGDSAAAGCDTSFAKAPTTQALGINALCSSSSVTCVGGTEFADFTNPSAYWSSTNNTKGTGYTGTGYESVLSYIPEGAWNEPTSSTGAPVVAGTGGGVSTIIAKPSWQTALASTPATANFRSVPDISFSASGHDGYFACLDYALGAGSQDSCVGDGAFFSFGGTSASAPGMAGIAALLNTKLGKAQGNLNPLLYRLATSTPNVFHDSTFATSGVSGTSCDLTTPSMCNNSTPSPTAQTGGLQGYGLLTGYDLATGLGSLDVANFLTAAAASATVTTSLTESANPTTAAVNQNVAFSVTLTPGTSTSTPTGTVQFYANGTAIGAAATVTNNAASLTYAFTTAGSYAITATYSGDTNFATSTASGTTVVVNPNGFTITPSTTTYNLISGATTGNTDAITIMSTGSFAGTVALTCAATNVSGTAAGSCNISPNSASLTAGSSTSSTVTITTTPGTSGVLNVVVSGTSGGTTVASATVMVNLTAPSFSMTAVPTSVSVNSGASATSTVTIASVNGFAGTVNFTCSASKVNGTDTAAGSCSASPASVTLAAGGSSTTTMNITTVAGSSGALQATLSGSGTTSGATIAATSSVMVTATITAPSFTITANPTVRSINSASGSTTTSTLTVTSVNGFAGTVTLNCATVTNFTCSLASTSVALTAGSSATDVATLTPTVGSSGTVTETITGTGTTSGATIAASAAATVTVTVSAPAFTISASAPNPAAVPSSGASTTSTLTITSTNGFAGNVALSCSTAAAASCSFAPTGPVALTAGGTATVVVTITPTIGSSGTLAETITGTGTTTGGSTAISATATVTVAVAPPGFTIAPSPTTLSFTSGATTGNTDTVTVTSANGFVGSVALTCAVAATGSTPFYPPTCTVAPTSLTLAAGGNGTAVVTVASTTAVTTTQAQKTVVGQLATGGAIFAMLFFCIPARRRRALRTLATILLLASGLAAMTGCGGGGNAPPTTVTHSSAGTYTVTVTGSGTTTGGSAASTTTTTFTVTIN